MGIKRVKKFPWGLEYPQHIVEEWTGREDEVNWLVQHSKKVWIISNGDGPLFVVGLFSLSLLGSGFRLWFVPCGGFYNFPHHSARFAVRAMRKLKKKLGAVSVLVRDDLPKNVRFVEWLGLARSESSVDGHSWYFVR